MTLLCVLAGAEAAQTLFSSSSSSTRAEWSLWPSAQDSAPDPHCNKAARAPSACAILPSTPHPKHHSRLCWESQE